jgi:hypothetical protein
LCKSSTAFFAFIKYGVETTVKVSGEESGSEVSAPQPLAQHRLAETNSLSNPENHGLFVGLPNLSIPAFVPSAWVFWANNVQHLITEREALLQGAVAGAVMVESLNDLFPTQFAQF